MFYRGLNNSIDNNFNIPNYIRSKVLVNNIRKTLVWTDKNLWGTKINNREFVMYTKIHAMDEIPNELLRYAVSDAFITKNYTVICKQVGRYNFNVEGRVWILDVVFPEITDTSWSSQTKNEYTRGNFGIFSSWEYDYLDSNMIEFTMSKINNIERRTMINIIRYIMKEMSSENSRSALLTGNWSEYISDGVRPHEWSSPAEIFKVWNKTRRPVRYAQCWIFAECLTEIFRFLGIPSRTIFAENCHMDTSLNKGIDMMMDCESVKSDEEKDTSYFVKIDNICDYINRFDIKSLEDLDECVLYNGDDSLWNLHYWNEIYIPINGKFGWNCVDCTPSVRSKDEPFAKNKLLGPCRVDNIKNCIAEPYDFTYLHSSVNSPFRIWSNETIVSRGDVIIIPILKAVVYPLFPEKSIFTSDVRMDKIQSKRLRIETKVSIIARSNILGDYVSDYKTLSSYLENDNPVVFGVNSIELKKSNEETYYVQQVTLNRNNEIVNSKVEYCKLSEIKAINIRNDVVFVTTLVALNDKFWSQLIHI